MILEGARAVFAGSSYTNANTAKVARAAGVSAPALYRYFPSKKQLYLSTLKDAGPRLLHIWQRLAQEAADPLDLIWTLGLAYYDRVLERSPVMRLWFQALGEVGDRQVRAALAGNFTAAVDFLERNLEAGKAQGLVRRDLDARVAAWHFMAIGLTFDLIHLLGRDHELDRSKVENWGRLYLESVQAAPRGSSAPHRRRAASSSHSGRRQRH
ncbi:MAG: TetR/AcrR family transcriptional regulator [Deltaproteobacteria bacterium]|nr:TetR/AcrR family transcriptional regulator [Deltaproteobacteria bacterium]